jgi:predicted polyphosphate/ATP-dependent NAD kinase
MGGRVGLKGTDGEETLLKALKLGVEPVAPKRTVETLKVMGSVKYAMELITYPRQMGEDEAKESGFTPSVIGSIDAKTTAIDTVNAARKMVEMGVDLVLFVGGDGTARDVYEAVEEGIPVLGIPAGVKVHSAVFAIDPEAASRIATKFVQIGLPLKKAEVVDIDEDEFRRGRLSTRIFGHMLIPFELAYVQSIKISSPLTPKEKADQLAVAERVVKNMKPSTIYILGPGTTVQAVAEVLGIQKSLLGVDLMENGRLVALDVNERQILSKIEDREAKIVVTPIGGQGFVFGRGNQQISPNVLRTVRRENIIIISTSSKLHTLRKLMVDTGDVNVDKWLRGQTHVITEYGDEEVSIS